MNGKLVAALLLSLGAALPADDRGRLIFEDAFERNERDETREEIGNGWGTNSKSRAGGNKQVDLRDGAMHIRLHPAADHAVSVTHPIAFRDGAVELRFMLEEPQDKLGLDFADLQFKEVHAGHLFKVDVGPRSVQINDMKTGNMNMQFYEARKAKSLTAGQKEHLATTTKTFPASVSVGEWHTLLVTIRGETVSVSIDGQAAGTFTSSGFAHPTKRMLRLAAPRNAVVDDVKIWASST